MITTGPNLSRRDFLVSSAALLLATELRPLAADADNSEPIIDIHQHTNYSGRSNDQLIAHQRAMGISLTVLQPAGRMYGLDAQCGGNRTVLELARQHPQHFVFFANEVAGIKETRQEITSYLKQGAIGIGEQKFRVDGDSKYFHVVAEVAQEFQVPVLMHFQHNAYNTSIERFHKTLEQFPTVNFIGHAQTWWGNTDKNHDQTVLYPKGKVTPGGITDRLLSDYPNMYGDLSAGSGLNFLTRDEDHARAFLERHQNKLMYGSDCDDRVGSGPMCQGAQTIAKVKQLAPNKTVERKLFYENAKRVLKL